MLVALALLIALDAPPEPQALATPQPWACTAHTLGRGLRCTFEGTSPARAPSEETQKTARSQALVIGQALCASPTTALKDACTQKLDAALVMCGGDGTRPFLDDDGHFNPGHASCYAALRTVAMFAARANAEANGCCSCLDASKGDVFNACAASVAADRLPHNVDRCRSSCASVLLRIPTGAPSPPPPAPAPAVKK